MMARGGGRLKQCTVPDASGRLSKAEQFLLLAGLATNDAALRSAEASNLVLAGIAASDAICCIRLGYRSGAADHGEAVDLLAGVDVAVAKALDALLRVKSVAQYDAANPTSQQLRSARRAAESLVIAARAAVASARERSGS